MRSGLANVLLSFGAVFLSFGITFLIIGILGVRFGSKPSLGAAGLFALVGLVGGAAMAGGAVAMGKKSTE